MAKCAWTPPGTCEIRGVSGLPERPGVPEVVQSMKQIDMPVKAPATWRRRRVKDHDTLPVQASDSGPEAAYSNRRWRPRGLDRVVIGCSTFGRFTGRSGRMPGRVRNGLRTEGLGARIRGATGSPPGCARTPKPRSTARGSDGCPDRSRRHRARTEARIPSGRA